LEVLSQKQQKKRAGGLPQVLKILLSMHQALGSISRTGREGGREKGSKEGRKGGREKKDKHQEDLGLKPATQKVSKQARRYGAR
jgi:hypothetical protein